MQEKAARKTAEQDRKALKDDTAEKDPDAEHKDPVQRRKLVGVLEGGHRVRIGSQPVQPAQPDPQKERRTGPTNGGPKQVVSPVRINRGRLDIDTDRQHQPDRPGEAQAPAGGRDRPKE